MHQILSMLLVYTQSAVFISLKLVGRKVSWVIGCTFDVSLHLMGIICSPRVCSHESNVLRPFMAAYNNAGEVDSVTIKVNSKTRG